MVHKKKIIIVNNNLAIGGIQKALINLLDEIKEKYEVTLFIYHNDGEFKKNVPSQVKVLEANSLLKLLGVSQKGAKKEGVFLYFFRAILVIWTKFISNCIPFKILITSEKKLQDYDVAISYLQSSDDNPFYGGCNEFVLRRIDASKKIAYIHCDYLNFGGNTLENNTNYKKFDTIVAVSEGCKKNFLRVIPELKDKIQVVRNCHNYKEIKRIADTSPIIYRPNEFNIVTVSRLSKEKGILRTIHIISQLIMKGHKICWHIVGEGYQRKEIEALIESYSLVDNIILYGNQKNPYRYMVNADLFLLPSYHEAAPMVFNEAKYLGLPILATETASSKEIIEDEFAGWVCENSIKGIAEKLEYILEHTNDIRLIRERLKKQKFDNELALEQFNHVVNEGISNV